MGTKVMRIIELNVTTLESLPPQYVINATGQVNTGGWANPRLEPIGEVTDGIQDYDFVADPPKPGVMVTQGIATLKALPINLGRTSSSIRGIRIHSATNNIQKLFDIGVSDSTVIAGGVDIWPLSMKQVPKSVPVSLRDIIGHSVRVLRPGDSATQEVKPGRVTIYLDDKGSATDVVVEPDFDVK